MATARRRLPSGYDFGQIRIPDFLLAAALIYDGAGLAGFSFQLITIAVMLLLAFSRQPTVTLGRHKWVPVVLAVGLFYVMTISFVSTPSPFAFDWTRRLFRMAEMFLLVIALAHGQLHVPSVLKGMLMGLLGNAVAFYLRLTPDTYLGSLTGFIGDKNKAGMFYAILGVMALIVARSPQIRALSIATFGVLVWLTDSRTSIAAYVLGIAWVYVVAGLSAANRFFAGVGVLFLVPWLESTFSLAGSFASRVGSDRLRGRIDAATQVKVDAAHWFGNGLGEAYVMLDGQRWLFHNSYNTMLVEGGWPWTILVAGLTIVIMLRPTQSGRVHFESRVLQGAGVTLLICALRLGEVFVTVPWAIAMGVALHYLVLTERQKDRADELPPLLEAVSPGRR